MTKRANNFPITRLKWQNKRLRLSTIWGNSHLFFSENSSGFKSSRITGRFFTAISGKIAQIVIDDATKLQIHKLNVTGD